MKIIVGIGNPGPRYAGTRHNTGYRVIEKVAQKLGAGTAREQFGALVREALVDGQKTLLMKPLTFVNFSGVAVRRAADWFGCPPDDVIAVCDDMSLPPARIRVRRAGGSGGHNGLQSIIDRLGTSQFPRVRIGVGSPGPGIDGADYVLSRFGDDEEDFIEKACEEAADALLAWIRRGIDECMNTYNRPPG